MWHTVLTVRHKRSSYKVWDIIIIIFRLHNFHKAEFSVNSVSVPVSASFVSYNVPPPPFHLSSDTACPWPLPNQNMLLKYVKYFHIETCRRVCQSVWQLCAIANCPAWWGAQAVTVSVHRLTKDGPPAHWCARCVCVDERVCECYQWTRVCVCMCVSVNDICSSICRRPLLPGRQRLNDISAAISQSEGGRERRGWG